MFSICVLHIKHVTVQIVSQTSPGLVRRKITLGSIDNILRYYGICKWTILYKMDIDALLSSEGSNSEFVGFNPEEITIENDFVPDLDPDSDITVSSVDTDDLFDLGEEEGADGNDINLNGENGEVQPEWSQNFRDIQIDDFTNDFGPVLPDTFDAATATPIDYFNLLFKPEIFNQIRDHTNNYAIYRRDDHRTATQNPDYNDSTWYEITVEELRALFGVTILMGINGLPQFRMYWDVNEFIGNIGIKKTFTSNRYQKVMQHLHISDRASELPRNDPNHDKLHKIRPVLEMVNETFRDHYKPSKNQTIDEGMVAYKGRLSYMQYMPAKLIKRGIKIWMRCDAESAYLHQFNIYLGRGNNSPNGLEYDVVMKLCQDLVAKKHHVYFDILFTSIPLMNDLLQLGIYACGTVHKDKHGLPGVVKVPGKMVRGAHKSYQHGETNLVATVWQDNKQVRLLSTNSKPAVVCQASRRIGHETVHVNQPENVHLYNKYMNGVDRHDQLRMQYVIGRFAHKAWKYLMWFLVNASIVNSFIIYQKVSTRTTKKRYAHIHFQQEVACQLIAGFSG